MPGEAEQASSNPRKRKKSDAKNSTVTDMSLPVHGHLPLASTSSGLQAVLPLITPRTPRSAFVTEEEEVEMKRFNMASGLSNNFADPDDDKDEVDGLLGRRKKASTLSLKDKHAIVLLIILYLIQGVPVGLAMGSMPFLLKTSLSYSQIGVFTLSGYPYSLKLFWSPIVDALFIRRIGRRKTWIIPMQLIIGTTLLWMSVRAEYILDHPETKVYQLTAIFTVLVFMSATQDIAVDGWALTLLSEENLSYASTCQTIGLNTGFFSSFTMFLAFSSPEFANMLGIPVLTLGGYLRFWGILCYCVTFWLVFFKREDPVPSDDPDLDVGKVYKIMWNIVKLKHVWALCCIHFIAKIGFVANDAITNLKLTEKGLRTEQLSVMVTIDFIVQLFGGYYAARWAIGDKPLRPWLYAFWARLAFAVTSMLIVHSFPLAPVSTGFLVLVAFNYIASQFSTTIQFVGMSAFHTRISDPVIGGTYMTLLNTATNLGGTWPRYFVMKGVDTFSKATCHIVSQDSELLVEANECISEPGKLACRELGGTCVTERDGYYYVSSLCVAVGAVLLVVYITTTARRLQSLPTSKWRISQNR